MEPKNNPNSKIRKKPNSNVGQDWNRYQQKIVKPQ